MAEFKFLYSTVNAGKTMELLKEDYKYRERNLNPFLITSKVDTRAGGCIYSRNGFSRDAWHIEEKHSVLLAKLNDIRPDVILCDEVQFYKATDIMLLSSLAQSCGFDVQLYGLLKDFTGNLFECIPTIIRLATDIQEIPTTCWFCKRKATENLKLVDGEPVYEGEQVEVGGVERYLPVCVDHYMSPIL